MTSIHDQPLRTSERRLLRNISNQLQFAKGCSAYATPSGLSSQVAMVALARYIALNELVCGTDAAVTDLERSNCVLYVQVQVSKNQLAGTWVP